MSYIQETASKEEFLESRTSPRTKSNVEYNQISRAGCLKKSSTSRGFNYHFGNENGRKYA